MGQLSDGLESISNFQNGVNIMLAEYTSSSSNDDESDKQNLKRKISNALCSMTEIYLTDCW